MEKCSIAENSFSVFRGAKRNRERANEPRRAETSPAEEKRLNDLRGIGIRGIPPTRTMRMTDCTAAAARCCYSLPQLSSRASPAHNEWERSRSVSFLPRDHGAPVCPRSPEAAGEINLLPRAAGVPGTTRDSRIPFDPRFQTSNVLTSPSHPWPLLMLPQPLGLCESKVSARF